MKVENKNSILRRVREMIRKGMTNREIVNLTHVTEKEISKQAILIRVFEGTYRSCGSSRGAAISHAKRGNDFDHQYLDLVELFEINNEIAPQFEKPLDR